MTTKTTMTTMTTKATITALAPRVAATQDTLDAARDASEAAEAILLERIVATLSRSGLRAVGGKILLASSSTAGGSGGEEQTHAAWAGLCVSDDRQGPARVNQEPSASGRYGGTDLILAADGRWIELAYTGVFSCSQGSTCTWTATTRVLTARDVASEYDVDRILVRIADTLAAVAAGRAGARAAALTARAARLHAVAALLGSG